MSVADEILRIQQAKSDLATSITNKGVTVPAATTIDGYAALVDQIQQGGSSLPYHQVEYLMTDGSAYIDTGIQGKCAFEIVGGIKRSLTVAAGLFGYRTSTTSNCLCLIWYGDGHTNSGKMRFDFGSGTSAKVQNQTSASVANDTLLKYNLASLSAGSQTITPQLNSQEPTTGNLYLLGVNTNGALSLNQDGTYVKSAKIGKEGLTVRDYIPVRVGTVGYLYDKISGQLFGNANSTGAFILGPDVT